MMPIFAWNTPPTSAQLHQASTQAHHLIVVLENHVLPDWSDDAPLQAALTCVHFSGVNVLPHILPNATLWLLPEPFARRLRDYFGKQNIVWQTDAIEQEPDLPEKMWFRQPETVQPESVLVIGAGIAGAATAYELAQRGVQVTVLEANADVATAASGNRQGLLYAKISAHHTAQTELLLSGYGYTRRLLTHLLPESDAWQACGIVHLNDDAAETRRNQALAAQSWHQHLYRAVSAVEVSELAGISIAQSGLFWQYGVWMNPHALVSAMLAREGIELQTNCQVLNVQFDGQSWQVQTNAGRFSGSHIVFCGGANCRNIPIVQEFPFQVIRGQTSLAAASAYSSRLKIALSGKSYCAPAWDGVHCFGATFLPNDDGDDWRETDEWHNHTALNQLNPSLYQSLNFSGSLKGHAALRCDAHDHLPVVGALGNPAAMRVAYAKLAHDKHYRLDTPCPFYPNAFVNTAHGSRGLATAPLSGRYLAALITGDAQPLSQRLKRDLHPNRLIIREIVRGKSKTC